MELHSVGDNLENGMGGSSQSEQLSLIPGLPDDIALSCLARVPRKYHSLLNCVSKRWRELVYSKEWFSYRLKYHLEETWIYGLCRDKSEQHCIYMLDPSHLKSGWKRIHGFPSCCLKRKGMGFEVLGSKLYLFGGCGWIEDATSEVYCYDALTNMWSTVASLSTPRCFFAHEALNGKIYAIGGLGSKSSNPHSWDSYNPHTNCWSSNVDPNVIPEIEDSLVLDGKIYIRHGISTVSSNVFAAVCELSNGTWQHTDADFVSGWHGPAAVVDGVLYILDQTLGVRLRVWQKDSREWRTLKRLSALFTRPPCRLIAIGTKIFVIGKGLSTVVFDIRNFSNVSGVLVSFSVPKLISDYDVISCKALAI